MWTPALTYAPLRVGKERWLLGKDTHTWNCGAGGRAWGGVEGFGAGSGQVDWPFPWNGLSRLFSAQGSPDLMCPSPRERDTGEDGTDLHRPNFSPKAPSLCSEPTDTTPASLDICVVSSWKASLCFDPFLFVHLAHSWGWITDGPNPAPCLFGACLHGVSSLCQRDCITLS